MRKLLFLLLFPLLLTACGSTQPAQITTRGEKYGKLYEEAPVSILIIPPINNSNNVDAKEYFYTSLAIPLINKGYYVFSPYLMMDLFQQESAYDSELFLHGDLSSFREVVGADAALFTVISKWQKHSESIETEVEYILVSTHTNEVLYTHKGQLEVSTNLNTGYELIDAIGSLIKTVSTPIVEIARQCNSYVLSDLPQGKYSAAYMQDKEVQASPTIIRRFKEAD